MNVALIAQLAPAARIDPHVFVSAKSKKFGPPRLMFEMSSAALPVLVSVTLCVELVVPTFCGSKARLDGDRPTLGRVPVPLKLTLDGTPLLSLITIDAVRTPAPVGVNVAVITQFADAARELLQVLVWEKSPEFKPDRKVPVKFSVVFPALVKVTLCPALVAPTFCWPNARLPVERVRLGAVGGGVPPPPPPPPPQATQTPTTSSTITSSQPTGRRGTMAQLSSAAKASKHPNIHGHTRRRRKPGGTLGCGVCGLGLTFAVVAIENMAVTGEDPVTVTEGGEIVQVAPVGQAVAILKFTVPVNPFTGVTVSVKFPDCPAAGMVMLVGFADTVKSVTLIVTAGDVVDPE